MNAGRSHPWWAIWTRRRYSGWCHGGNYTPFHNLCHVVIKPLPLEDMFPVRRILLPRLHSQVHHELLPIQVINITVVRRRLQVVVNSVAALVFRELFRENASFLLATIAQRATADEDGDHRFAHFGRGEATNFRRSTHKN